MTGTSKQIRVALYARTSTTDQNPEMQLTELRGVAAQRGWVIIKEYVDHGHSGGKDRRPALDELMQLAASGGVDLCAVWKFDRFARSTQHLLRALETFRLQGVEFFSLRDSIDTSTPAGRFSFTIISAVAELEKELIRERVRAGIFHARNVLGKHCGRPAKRVDLAAVHKMLQERKTLREISKVLGCGLATLHRAVATVPKGTPSRSSDPSFTASVLSSGYEGSAGSNSATLSEQAAAP